MRSTTRRGLAAVAALALALTACGGDDTGEPSGDPTGAPTTSGAATGSAPPAGGPVITVGSFNFAESQILANIYAIALEDAGFPIETKLDLGSREVVLPELEASNIDFLPEYVGSALAVGFGGEPTGDLDATLAALQSEFNALDVTVLDPAPGEDKNAFVVSAAFAEEHNLRTVSDLGDIAGTVVFGGPPECQQRTTCLLALTDTYGLTNIEFESIQEGSVRVASLKSGTIQVALLFSTQPVIAVENFVTLDETEGAIPAENITPVVSSEAIEAYGEALVDLVNSVSALITTEVLIELNGRVELDAEDPEDVARQWLQDNGIIS